MIHRYCDTALSRDTIAVCVEGIHNPERLVLLVERVRNLENAFVQFGALTEEKRNSNTTIFST